MRIGVVIGKVSLRRVHPSLVGKRYVLAVPQSLAMLADRGAAQPEELVVIDELGATSGARIGFSEGGEAAVPYLPDRKPVDAYTACLIDDLTLDDREVSRLLDGNTA
jgi:ethanolamine utilization protein EutN